MKHHGSTCDFNEQRDRCLLLAFRKVILKSDCIQLDCIAHTVVNMPAPRFWVSDKRAAIVVSSMLKGHNPTARMNGTKRDMYIEICRRTAALMQRSPQLSLAAAVGEVVCSPAPRFYLTPGTARILYYRAKSRWALPHLRQVVSKADMAALYRKNNK